MQSTVIDLEKEIKTRTTTKVVLVLEYDGTRYHGFQLQADQPTIQAEIEEAIWKLTGQRLRIIPASRTDTGVHARGQVISFRDSSGYNEKTFIDGLNFHLPEDIAVKAAYKVGMYFNVRRDAVSREYNYYILNIKTRSPLMKGFSHRVTGQLDIAMMNKICRALIGEHDFASFTTNTGVVLKSTVRNVYKAEISRKNDMVIFNIVANSFLPHQVRNTVGALIRVGLGNMSEEQFYSIMGAKKIGLAGLTAPARGLFLTRVNYPLPFEEEK